MWMEGYETTETPPPQQRPRTITVLVMLVAVAIFFSYLAAFALSSALVSAELITPWAKVDDPRPRWFLIAFLIQLGLFVTIGVIARLASWRQLRSIDAMENAETPEDTSATV
jgi:uncharacterized RDD family membrane protein YckC